MKGLWLSLYCPLLGLEVLPGNADGPRVLLTARGDRVSLVGPVARRAGVRPGMTVSAALCLEPELDFRAPDGLACQRRLEGLALWCSRFSARVSLGEEDTVMMEIATMLDYFGGLSALWDGLHDELSTLELSVVCATGHTPLAAELLARAGGGCAQSEAEHLARLGALALSSLRLPETQQARLQGLGFRRIDDLLALPSHALASRLGPALTRYLARLTGELSDPSAAFVPPSRFDRQLEPGHEIERVAGVLFPLRRLLAELEGFLKVRCLKAQALSLSLYHEDGQQHLAIGHAGGEQAAEAWLELCRLRLERVTLERPVRRLRLSVTELCSLQVPPQDLFHRAAPRDTPEALMSRLRTRLGEDAVMQPGLRADYRPEQASCLTPQALGAGHPGRRPAKDEADGDAYDHRPAWLLASPLALGEQVLAGLVWVAGPERIASGWWDSAPARRDYHVVRWPDGRHGWVYRDAESQWWLHGWFG